MVKVKAMKQYKFILLIMFSVIGCQYEIEQSIDTSENAVPMSFFAGIEIQKDSIATRTILGGTSSDSYRSVLWNYQDEVYVTNGMRSSKFVNTTEESSDVALLEGELSQATDYYAAYPYSMVKGYSDSGFKIELPAVQTYHTDGVSSGSFPMVAQCEEGIFNFKNLCGIFALHLTGNETITSVTFSGKDASGKSISVAGSGTISMKFSENPSLLMDDSAITSVTLTSSKGVHLNPLQPTVFHIVLPVGTYNTFTITIKAIDGTVMTVKSKKSMEIKRSSRTSAASLIYSGIHYTDLNKSGETANCYIVSEAGVYAFKTVKGNSNESVGSVSSVEVLWESYGTDISPEIGDLIRDVLYSNGYIQFSTAATFREGNAVIAAKNSSGIILWSWHIWLTDMPDEQVYYNSAGTMMNRNLGATSATPGDVGALGLFYQWGRKDPFLGSSSISDEVVAKSTAIWPSSMESSPSTGTVDYITSHPMTFVCTSPNGDWHYSQDNTLWTSNKTKSIYDPCPAGWRVPRGGEDSIWSKSGGSSYYSALYDDSNKGFNFSGKFGSDQTIWYPITGYLGMSDGILRLTGTQCFYWSADPCSIASYALYLDDNGTFDPSLKFARAYGSPIRCQRRYD